MNPQHDKRRCKVCRYALAGLTRNRCPECGEEFDPADPTTFLGPPSIPKLRLVFLAYAPALVAVWCSWFPLTARDNIGFSAIGLAMIRNLCGPLWIFLINERSAYVWAAAAIIAWALWLTLIATAPLRRLHPGFHFAAGLLWWIAGCPAAAMVFD